MRAWLWVPGSRSFVLVLLDEAGRILSWPFRAQAHAKQTRHDDSRMPGEEMVT